MELNKLLDAYEVIRDRTDKVDALTKNYWELVSPTNYTPFIENNELDAFLKALEFTAPLIREELFSFEYDGLVIPQTFKANGKEYHIG